MSELLPAAQGPRLLQIPGKLGRKAFDRVDHLLVLLPAKPKRAHWQEIPDGLKLQAVARRSGKQALIQSRLRNNRATGITVSYAAAPGAKTFVLLKLAGKLLASALQDRPREIGLLLPGADARETRRLAEAFVLAAHAHNFAMPVFRSDANQHKALKSVRLMGLPQRLDLQRAEHAARAQNLARWLTALPSNKLDVRAYRALVKVLAEQWGWSQRFYSEAALKKLGAGAFLAVAQGNADRGAGILRISYRPKSQRKPQTQPIAVVGKGVLFDTGGNNLKPHKSMLDMHEDMAGSAVALATLQALSEMDYPHPVDCWLALTENRASATAYKPRDVVSACNGTSIEIIHTDAEGRMVLADTLALAGREKPRLIIDYATLTGTCVYALTERYSGVFSNRDPLNRLLTEIGQRVGERVWPFPMDEDFDEALESKRADVLQCSTEGSGDHILAARFLQRFVPNESAWIHMDLSAASRSEGLGQVPAGATGFGVRLSLALLQEVLEDARLLKIDE